MVLPSASRTFAGRRVSVPPFLRRSSRAHIWSDAKRGAANSAPFGLFCFTSPGSVGLDIFLRRGPVPDTRVSPGPDGGCNRLDVVEDPQVSAGAVLPVGVDRHALVVFLAVAASAEGRQRSAPHDDVGDYPVCGEDGGGHDCPVGDFGACLLQYPLGFRVHILPFCGFSAGVNRHSLADEVSGRSPVSGFDRLDSQHEQGGPWLGQCHRLHHGSLPVALWCLILSFILVPSQSSSVACGPGRPAVVFTFTEVRGSCRALLSLAYFSAAFSTSSALQKLILGPSQAPNSTMIWECS